MFRYLKSELKELQIILACDEEHKKVFSDVIVLGYKNNKSLKLLHLVRAVPLNINDVSRSKPSNRKTLPCELSSIMKNTNTFKSKHSKEVYQIIKTFNCNSKMVCLIECWVPGK